MGKGRGLGCVAPAAFASAHRAASLPTFSAWSHWAAVMAGPLQKFCVPFATFCDPETCVTGPHMSTADHDTPLTQRHVRMLQDGATVLCPAVSLHVGDTTPEGTQRKMHSGPQGTAGNRTECNTAARCWGIQHTAQGRTRLTVHQRHEQRKDRTVYARLGGGGGQKLRRCTGWYCQASAVDRISRRWATGAGASPRFCTRPPPPVEVGRRPLGGAIGGGGGGQSGGSVGGGSQVGHLI